MQLQEGSLSFEFADGWQAIQYDDKEGFYKNHVDRLSLRIKAVDFLTCNKGQHWWIEVKDFTEDNLGRLSGNEPEAVKETRQWLKDKDYSNEVLASRKKPYIIEEFSKKVVDTFAGLGVARRLDDSSLSVFYQACQPSQSLTVVLFLCLRHNTTDYPRLASRLRQKLLNRLKPLQINILVCNEHTVPADIGWTVRRNS